MVVVIDLVGEVGLVEGDGVGAHFGVSGEAARLVDGEVFGAFEGVVDGDGFAAGTRASARLAEVDGVVARAEVDALAVDAHVVVGDGEGVVSGAEVDVAVDGAVVEGEAVRAVVAAHGKRVDAAVYFVAVGVQGAAVQGDVAVCAEVEGVGVAVDGAAGEVQFVVGDEGATRDAGTVHDVVAQVAAGVVFAVGAACVKVPLVMV